MKAQILPIILVAAAFVLGIIFERSVLGKRSESTAHSDANANRAQAGANQNGAAAADPVNLASLDKLIRLVDPADRDRSHDRIHDALKGAGIDHLKRLAKELNAQRIDGVEQRRVLRSVYERWAELDPKGALATLAGIRDFDTSRRVVRVAFKALAAADFTSAQTAFTGIESTHLQREAVEGILDSRAESDPRDTLAWAETLSGSLKVNAIQEVVERWSEVDAPAALAYVDTLPISEATQELRRHAAVNWARSNPSSAAAYAETLPESQQTVQTLHEIARKWAANDPEGAVTWADSLQSTPAWRASIDGVAAELAQSNPQRAAEFALSLDDRETRRSVLHTVANTWSSQDLETAAAWVESLPPEDRIPASNGLLGNLLDHDPQAAAALYRDFVSGATGSESAEGLRHTAAEIAEHWSSFNPTEAAAWALTLPKENDIRQRAVEATTDRWVRSDLQEASTWIADLPVGKVRDIATERIVDHSSDKDPQLALEWAMTASDPDHQTEMLRHVFEHWQKVDPQAARASFEATAGSLSPGQHENVIEVFE